jgi:tRNA A-37 threonylcarbamoyl transferase component Bud32
MESTSSAEEFRRSWIGRVLEGRYRLSEELGRGGMATVYLATDERMERPVVVKVPDPRFLNDREFQSRFRLEVRSLVRLSHPHIVGVLDGGTADGVPYLVLTYLGGGSLKDRIGEDGRLDRSLFGRWLPGVAKALDFVHGLGVVHRDVKPANILFDEHDHVYLADFGIVKALGQPDLEVTQAGIAVGTPDYMAPEALLDLALDGRADQYALATIVYRTLSGRLPIAAATPMAALDRKANEDPPPLHEVVEDLNRDLSAVVMKGLARDREERFDTCGAFAVEFFRTRGWEALPLEVLDLSEADPDSTLTLQPIDLPATVAVPDAAVPEAVVPAEEAEEDRPSRVPGGRAGGRVPPPRAEEPPSARSRSRGLLAVIALLVALALGVGGWVFLGRNPVPPAPPAPEPAPPAPPGPVAPREVSVVLLEPASGAFVGDTVKVVGRVDAEGPFEVLVNGERAEVDGRAFEATVTSSETLDVEVRGDGVRGRATASLVVDREPPVLELEGPAEILTREATVRLVGGVEDEHPADEVLVDDVPHDVAEGRFELSLPAEAGEGRTFRLRAVDAAGNVSEERTVRIVRDATPPVFRWTRRPPALTRGESVVVAGTVEDAHPGGVVWIDDEPHELRDGRFEVTVALPEDGPREVRARTVDLAGNESTGEALRVVRDRTPPRIVLSSPPPALTRETEVVLAGKVEDAHPTESVRIDGRPHPLRDGRFEVAVPLPADGAREIRLRAVDAAGNEGAGPTVKVVRDRTPPRIDLDGPVDATTGGETFVVAGTVRDAHLPDHVLVRGERAELGADGRFSRRITLAKGRNAIPVEVTDRAENRTSRTITVARSRTLRVPGDFRTLEEAVAEMGTLDTLWIGPGAWDLRSVVRLRATVARGARVTIGRLRLETTEETTLTVRIRARDRAVTAGVQRGYARLGVEKPRRLVTISAGQTVTMVALEDSMPTVRCVHEGASRGQVDLVVLEEVAGHRVVATLTLPVGAEVVAGPPFAGGTRGRPRRFDRWLLRILAPATSSSGIGVRTTYDDELEQQGMMNAGTFFHLTRDGKIDSEVSFADD